MSLLGTMLLHSCGCLVRSRHSGSTKTAKSDLTAARKPSPDLALTGIAVTAYLSAQLQAGAAAVRMQASLHCPCHSDCPTQTAPLLDPGKLCPAAHTEHVGFICTRTPQYSQTWRVMGCRM